MSTEQAPLVVLITGVAHCLGARLAARLAADSRVDRVIGIDSTTPADGLVPTGDRVDVHRLDLRDPVLRDVLVDGRVDVVVHLGIATAPSRTAGGRQAMKEHNAIGTMRLLAACQQVPTLQGLVVRSSTAAYGASFRDPAVFTEDTAPLEIPRGGFARDVLDIEGYVRSFRRRCPGPRVTVLRFAPLVGSYTETSLTRYFAQPIVPTVLGRDPRLQFLHIDDALAVLNAAVVESHPGVFNVAGEGVLALSQAIRMAGRISVPVVEWGLDLAAALPRGARLDAVTRDRLDLLVHGRVVDTTRMVREFGIAPRSTAEAFDDFIQTHHQALPLTPASVAATETYLRDRLCRLRRIVRELTDCDD